MNEQGAPGDADQFPPQGVHGPGAMPPRGGWQMPGPPPPRSGGFTFSDFFTFRFMITPVLVEVIYLVGFVGITLFALVVMVVGSAAPIGVEGGTSTGGAAAVVAGLLLWIGGQLVFRVYMEVVIVLFRIHGSLDSIDRRGRGM